MFVLQIDWLCTSQVFPGLYSIRCKVIEESQNVPSPSFVARNTDNKSHKVENDLNPGVMYIPQWNLILLVKGLAFQHPEQKPSS